MKIFGAAARDVLSGVAFLVVIALMLGGVLAMQAGVFSGGKTVTAVLPQAGAALEVGSSVQFRRVRVGTVTDISARPGRAILRLSLDPSRLDSLPAGAQVRILPRNLFGTEYVDLVPPPHATSGHLQPGDELHADTSAETVGIQRALTSAYDLLSSVQPAKLQVALSAIAQALDGRGEQLAGLVRDADSYLSALEPHTPTLVHDVAQLADVTAELGADAPDLLSAMRDAVATSRTIVSHREDLHQLLAAGTALSTTAREVLAANQERLITLVHVLAPTTQVLDSYRGQLPPTVTNLQRLLTRGTDALDDGPFLNSRITVDIRQIYPYTAADCPVYPPDMRGPNCGGSSAAAQPAAQPTAQPTGGSVGPVGSTEEKATVSGAVEKLLDPLTGSLPDLADILIGPLLRGSSVVVP